MSFSALKNEGVQQVHKQWTPSNQWNQYSCTCTLQKYSCSVGKKRSPLTYVLYTKPVGTSNHLRKKMGKAWNEFKIVYKNYIRASSFFSKSRNDYCPFRGYKSRWYISVYSCAVPNLKMAGHFRRPLAIMETWVCLKGGCTVPLSSLVLHCPAAVITFSTSFHLPTSIASCICQENGGMLQS